MDEREDFFLAKRRSRLQGGKRDTIESSIMRSIKHIAAVVCSSIFFFSLFSAEAQEKTRIAWAALNPAASPMWVVQEKGLLRKQGVDAEIIGINSSPIAMQALLAGDLDVIVTSVTTLVGTRLAGADTIMVQRWCRPLWIIS
jgi:ABC-type nitrate/sulfonate/bicarbonate transport system substrate-binding protein